MVLDRGRDVKMSHWTRRATNFARYSPGDQLLVLRAALLLAVLRLALTVFPFGELRRRALRWSGPRPDAEGPGVERTVGAVWRASLLVPTAKNCLLRSLVVHHLLARQGIDSALRIGVRTGDNGFSAHAWIEVDGNVVTPEGQGVESWAAFEGSVLEQSGKNPLPGNGPEEWQEETAELPSAVS